MKKDQSERRIFKRRPLRTEVYFEDENGERLFYVMSRDVSLGGIFIEGELPMKSESLILISFFLPNHKRLVRASGEVVRKMGQGVGVRFSGLSEAAQKWLEEYLE